MPPDLDPDYVEQMRNAGIEPITLTRAEEKKSGLGFWLRVFRGLFSTRPYVAQKYVTAELKEKLASLVKEAAYDAVVCDFLEMAWCAPLLRCVPSVLFEHNVESMIWRRHTQVARNPLKKLYLIYEQRRMANFERWAGAQFDLVLTVSAEDGEMLRESFGVQKFLTIPTGVDIEYFQAIKDSERDNHLVLSGSMDWMPNIDAFWWFYREIYPRVREEIPAVSLAVVGRRPPNEIRAVTAGDNSVEVTGTVPDVRPHVAGGQLFLVPLRVGGGTRIKIYEALAMGKCVVATSIGAEGLPLSDGEHLVLADTAADFAVAIRDLLQDDKKRNRIAGAGQRLVRERYSWSYAAAILYDGLRESAGCRAGFAADNGSEGLMQISVFRTWLRRGGYRRLPGSGRPPGHRRRHQSREIEMLNAGRSPIVEDKIAEIMAEVVGQGKLTATLDSKAAINDTEVSLICVGTPSRENGDVDLSYILRVTEKIGQLLKIKSGFHTLIYRSTIPPGTTEDQIIPLLEESSGKKIYVDFDVCFNPEFLREGSSVYDFYNPPFTVVGLQSQQATEVVESLYSFLGAPGSADQH